MDNKDLIKEINDFQSNPVIKMEGMEDHPIYSDGFPAHALTCGNDSNHKVLKAVEKDGKVILVCEDCDYTQDYIPDIP